MLSTEIANIVVMTMAESWMTKVSAVIVEFLLLVRVGFWSGLIRAEGGASHGDHRVEGDRNCGPLDHHGRQFHGFLSFLMALPGLAGGRSFLLWSLVCSLQY